MDAPISLICFGLPEIYQALDYSLTIGITSIVRSCIVNYPHITIISEDIDAQNVLDTITRFSKYFVPLDVRRKLAIKSLHKLMELDGLLEKSLVKEDEKGNNILIIGSWCAGFSLCKHLSNCESVLRVFFSAPCSACSTDNCNCCDYSHLPCSAKINVVSGYLEEESDILNFITENDINLTVILSLPLLQSGFTEVLSGVGHACFGPTTRGCIVSTSQVHLVIVSFFFPLIFTNVVCGMRCRTLPSPCSTR